MRDWVTTDLSDDLSLWISNCCKTTTVISASVHTGQMTTKIQTLMAS
jgi:hypothetical protein